ncbi:TVP38/TMEM64 family protein [Flavimarina sp. Hel_I_48]|uniref:TVP38/TMEM64 family protein n=1 Tax=Flavimarina sp. Hel_I_48 TaxID=1392488 RepID=UPI001F13937A|nr:TVP38/TMEM64 family protein [Flavimarina sp. Hel_I_48]
MILGIVGCYFFIPTIREFMDTAWSVLTSDDEQHIQEWVSGFGWLGPILLILAMVVQMFLIVIPTIALMVVSILAYGPIWGSVIVLMAVFAASSVGYFIGRYLGKNFITKLLGEKTENKITKFIESYGSWAVIITRLNPLLSNDAISFIAGLLKMGYWKFIGATMVGILPLTVFIAILGKYTEQLKTGLLWGSILSLSIFICYVLLKKYIIIADDHSLIE